MDQAVIPTRMLAAVMTDIKKIEIKTQPIPSLSDNEILVKLQAVGICGSDIHYFEHGGIGNTKVKTPFILGHECAGEVIQIGRNVEKFTLGDRVAIEPGVACRLCENCKLGRYNLCPSVAFFATPPIDGALCQFVKIRADFAHVIPDQLSYQEAALIEPFSVSLHAAHRTCLRLGHTVAITGMGPVGLMSIIAAKAYGAKNIIVSDVEPKRLEIAKQLGATHVLNPISDNVIEEIFAVTNNKGVDLAWECSGNKSAFQTILQTIKRGGKMAVIGLPPEENITFNIHTVSGLEVDIIGIFRYANTYSQGIDILGSGQYDLQPLMTNHYGLEDTQIALEKAMYDKKNSIKIMIYPND
ncbi:NAD(P)-dependent alcohol dehydrogenase [Oceanobacillus sp. FSL W7-1293]|uniref:NAD(P)-dependent alcohol dehydrogenase n=1 Tax=Oceanobacillus sp. FSL W7-1293 TaxID=2921699 RepID=UPI0030CA9BDE